MHDTKPGHASPVPRPAAAFAHRLAGLSVAIGAALASALGGVKSYHQGVEYLHRLVKLPAAPPR